MSTKTSKAPAPMRWNIETAAREFDLNPRTLSKSLTQNDEVPGADGLYSTKQITAAVFTDYKAAQARKMAAEARMAERADKRDAGEVIDSLLVTRAWEAVTMQIKNRVQLIPSKLQSRLALTEFQTKTTEQECDDALSELSRTITYDNPVEADE